MSKFKNILLMIFLTLLAIAFLSNLLDLSGKRKFLHECKIHPWTCEK